MSILRSFARYESRWSRPEEKFIFAVIQPIFHYVPSAIFASMKKDLTRFCSLAASLFIARLSELSSKAFFALTLKPSPYFVENCSLEIWGRGIFQRWKSGGKILNSIYYTLPFWSRRSNECEADANTSNIRSCFFTLGGKSWEQENIFGCDKQKKE